MHISFFLNKCIYLFIFGCVGSSLLRAGFLQLRRVGATLCCGARASHCGDFCCCGARALDAWASVVVARGFQSAGSVAVAGSRAQAQQFWRTGLVAPRHVGFSWTRARTCVPCTGRWTLNHCTTREVPMHISWPAVGKIRTLVLQSQERVIRESVGWYLIPVLFNQDSSLCMF